MQSTAARLSCSLDSAVVINPKRDAKSSVGRAGWYPYYAGFSAEFALTIIDTIGLGREKTILDPWNGSGTTTLSALRAGQKAIGFDLNPVMVVAAKAQTVSPLSKESLRPLAAEILDIAVRTQPPKMERADPLLTWLNPESAGSFRRIEAAIQHLLVARKGFSSLSSPGALEEISDLASLFYVALFRSLRSSLKGFFSSNPTWVKSPYSPRQRLRPTFESITATFNRECEEMIGLLAFESRDKWQGTCQLAESSSISLPLDDRTVDLVLTSPPYCTRIDYAVATRLELALLGFDPIQGFDELRKKLMGTAMVPKTAPKIQEAWGPTCNRFLTDLSAHPSKASQTYYLKNHLQYFDGLAISIREIGRVLKPGGACVLVVQDSYYKDIHTDLPTIALEMAAASELSAGRRVDFVHHRTRAGINPATRLYRSQLTATESVLLLRRN